MENLNQITENFRFDYIEEWAKAKAFKKFMNDTFDKELKNCTIYDDFRIVWHGRELTVPMTPEIFKLFESMMDSFENFWNEMIRNELGSVKSAILKAVQ